MLLIQLEKLGAGLVWGRDIKNSLLDMLNLGCLLDIHVET